MNILEDRKEISIENFNINNQLEQNNDTGVLIQSTTYANHNNSINNGNGVESQIEYSLCGLFSILYPFSANFETDISQFNVQSTSPFFVPKLDKTPSWNEITEQSESLYSSPSSSIHGGDDMDISDISSQSSTSSSNLKTKNINSHNTSTTKINKSFQNNSVLSHTNSNNSNNNNYNNHNNSKNKSKKLFIGGITFDDLSNDSNLKEIRIQKITALFHSFGKISLFDPHWQKGYLFVHYQNPKDAHRVFQNFAIPHKKSKFIQTIRESLIKENLDSNCAPSTIYVRFPTNPKSKK
ncbi:hypothetical protein DLAC_11612 [Tieghemostelium lacteum]|uniref:RRM domain-containing protein n=1 Tax=Tieghemostelium lacteum TaxID=361077 RepID=A0A151ZIH4_TIELA|nr:hypothetical protein DLAC_11612 [Tieghemostelium lacteum]|eukprot:KYQ93699.1 hypothetical protein DLAC_11612 [Tieghemostelium lacteum]